MRTYCLIRPIFVYAEDMGAVLRLPRGTSITLYISENHKGITHGYWERRRIRVFALDVEENGLHAEAWWGNWVM